MVSKLFVKVYEQYRSILEHRYPSLKLQGENYPPPYLKLKLAEFLVII